MIPDRLWKGLARWATSTPRPVPPQLIPGLPGVNAQLMQDHRERLVAWKIGRAEALQYGIEDAAATAPATAKPKAPSELSPQPSQAAPSK